MKNNNELKKNSSLIKRIFAAAGIAIPFLADTFAVIDWTKGKEFPWQLFLVSFGCIFLVLLFSGKSLLGSLLYTWLHYRKCRDQLFMKAEADEQKKNTYGYDLEKIRRRHAAKAMQYLLTKGLICLIPVVTLYVFLKLNPINAYAFWNVIHFRPAVETNAQQEAAPDNEADDEPDKESENSDHAEADSEHPPENEPQLEDSNHSLKIEHAEESIDARTLKPERYRFVLTDPDRAPELDQDIVDQVYFYGADSETALTDYISAYVEENFGRKKSEIASDSIENDGSTYSTYSTLENDFIKDIEDCRYMQYLDDWEQSAPRSTELDKIIEGRTTLNSIETEGVSGCHELWWALANNYQYYALEYEYQTKNEEAIQYYYTMSIYCCMEALKYDLGSEEYNTIYNYMITRYKDLSSSEAAISAKYKSRASKILDAFVN